MSVTVAPCNRCSTGTVKPFSVATARPMLTSVNVVITLSAKCAFIPGCATSALALACRIASVTVAPIALRFAARTALMSTFTERWNTGAAQASTIRRAAILRMPASGLDTPSKVGACSVAVTSAVLLRRSERR